MESEAKRERSEKAIKQKVRTHIYIAAANPNERL